MIANKFLDLLKEQIEFEIGERVYHVLDSTEGIITNWQLFGDDGTVNYTVCFGPAHFLQLDDLLMSREKPVILDV
jgi:hypothetical protein